jgi:hypothetical protein
MKAAGGVMSFNRYAPRRLLYVVGLASLLMVLPQLTSSFSKTLHQVPDSDLGIGSSQVNRALKADKLIVGPKAVEPNATRVPRPRSGSDIEIGCERPFSAMVSTRSDLPGRCIASAGRLDPTPA